MHQLWRHPNGTYYVLFGPRLRRRISTREKDRGRAEAFLGQFIAGSHDPVIPQPTVAEILEAYRADREPRVRSKQTLRFSVSALAARLGTLLPSNLTPATVRRYASERGAANGSILREIGTLRAALAWGVEHKWLTTQPIIRNPVQAPPPRDRWITKDEARKLIAACQEPHVRLFVILGLATAARTGAILAARWPQVDFERRVIDYGEGHGNKRRAVVPLNDEALAALKAAKVLACGGTIVEYRGQPVKTLKTGFAAACRRAKLLDVTPHILRHSAATWMAQEGVPIRELARMLGDSEATTERVYAKHSPDYLRGAARALQVGPGGQ